MQRRKEIRKIFGRKRILIPVILGLLVAGWLVLKTVNEVRFYDVPAGSGNYAWNDVNNDQVVNYHSEEEFVPVAEGDYKRESFTEAISKVKWTTYSTLAILAAILMMFVRDFCYMWRIRILTDKELTWKQSFHVIMVWEFASAMTPGIVGGAAVAMFILNKEKINLGRATSLVLITAMLDELFYILLVPLMVLIVGTATMFPADLTNEFLGKDWPVTGLFWLSIALISLITLVLFTAVFISPRSFKNLLLFFCRLPLLRRLKHKAEKTGDDIIITSQQLKGKSFLFWTSAFVATACSWTGRFLVINFIILAFNQYADQFIIFARQLSMWVILLISPTPGGSGIAEFAFTGFLSDLIPFGLAGILAIIWRLISYYPYLFLGALIIPGWMQKRQLTEKDYLQNN